MRGTEKALLVGRKHKGDGYTLEAAAVVYEAMLNRKKYFLPAQFIRKLIKNVPMTDFQRQDAIKHLQGSLGVSYASGLRDFIVVMRAKERERICPVEREKIYPAMSFIADHD